MNTLIRSYNEVQKQFYYFYNGEYYLDVDCKVPMVRKDFFHWNNSEWCSGLTDINGKKIFVGDIYNMGDESILYVVEWIDCGLKGRQISNKSCVGLDYWNDKIVIVSNIHDNPELLKVQ